MSEEVKNRESDDLFSRVDRIIDRIRPAIQADGGDVELVDIQDGIVRLRLMGACVGCPLSTMTLQAGIERLIRQEEPEIKGVMSV